MDFLQPLKFLLPAAGILFLFTFFNFLRHCFPLLRALNKMSDKLDRTFALTQKTQKKAALFPKKKKRPAGSHSLVHDLLFLWGIHTALKAEKQQDFKARRNRYRRDLVNTLLNRVWNAAAR